MRVVRLNAAQRHLVAVRRPGEQPLGRRIHQRHLAGIVGHDDRIGDRIDNHVEAIAFGARLGFSQAHAAIVFRQLLGGPAQVRHVPQNRNNACAFALVVNHGPQQFEQQIRPVHGVNDEQFLRFDLSGADGDSPERRRQKHVVELDSTAGGLR